MSRSSLPLLLLLAACGGGEGAGAGVSVTVAVGASEVPFGAPFPLAVVRTHGDGLVPAPFEEGSLAPLLLRLEERRVRPVPGGTEERLRFTARAFRTGEVAVPGLRFEAVPAAGGRPRTAAAEPFTLRVLPSLDPAAPGDLEPPPPSLPPPRSPWIAAAAAAALLGAAGLLAARARRRRAAPPPAVPPPPGPDPREAARARAEAALRALRGGSPAEGVIGAAAAVRALLEEVHGIRTRERTTEEVLSSAAPPLRPRVAAVLGPADLVKFAGDAPGAEERDRVLDAAAALAAGEGPR